MADEVDNEAMKAWREQWEADSARRKADLERQAEEALEERNRQNREAKERKAAYRDAKKKK